jgi:hypothetical protein
MLRMRAFHMGYNMRMSYVKPSKKKEGRIQKNPY